MKVFVTGADGMLGSHVVRNLIEAGHEVTALVLKGRETGTLDGLNINKIEGDILDQELLTQQMAGHPWVLHAAANVQTVPPKDPFIRTVNIDGTKNVIEASLANNVERIVCMGTAISFGFGSKSNLGDETKPYMAHKYKYDYMDSKEETLRIVQEAVKERNLPAISLCPTMMFGRYDLMPNAGRMIQAIATGKLPVATPGGKNFLNAADAATAVVNAFTMGRIGESYILGNENMSYMEAFRKMAVICGVKPPKRTLPKFLVMFYGGMMTFFSKFTGNHPTPSYREAMIACDHQYFDVSKAVEELKLPLNPVEQGFQAYIDWCKEEDIKFE